MFYNVMLRSFARIDLHGNTKMKKSTKAALLSAFVFPGAGHIFLKKYVPGSVLAGTAFTALYYLTAKAVARAMEIVDKIQSGEIPPDIAVITELVSKQPTGTEALRINIATAIFIISWIAGMVDAYRVGRPQDSGDGAGG